MTAAARFLDEVTAVDGLGRTWDLGEVVRVDAERNVRVIRLYGKPGKPGESGPARKVVAPACSSSVGDRLWVHKDESFVAPSSDGGPPQKGRYLVERWR